MPFFGGVKITEAVLLQVGRGGMRSSIFSLWPSVRPSLRLVQKTRALFLCTPVPVRRAHVLAHVFNQPAATEATSPQAHRPL
jgi:hypothetical protein